MYKPDNLHEDKKPIFLSKFGLVLELVDSLDLKSSGIYSRGGSSPPEATTNSKYKNFLWYNRYRWNGVEGSSWS